MKRSLSRRIEHLAQVVAPCAACEERARQDEESRKSMASLAERLQGAALAREQAKGAAAWKSEAVRLSAEAAELRQRASMLEATDWRAALARSVKGEPRLSANSTEPNACVAESPATTAATRRRFDP